ncbi:hypothetical protein DRW41_17260 [Neobacillus piezotolerans]|uniref:Uncharacterized protein n=1 Tax=Neobacillus piezotolerans TaxID=2259171 RepID=A0A3D8GMM7_9BACI|nr:hypothetical protein [Neobacillus piezotolerans]RDU35489.1 hypothetical protein DRW41_17260 [Neobacillus piezotolerans]
MRSRTFFAAKINIHGNIFSQDLDELIFVHIPRVILESESKRIHSWNWSFTDIESINVENRNLITGNLTKSKHANQNVKVGKKTVKKKSEDELAHTAFFVYDISNEILVHESTGAISQFDFRRVFTDLLSRDPLVGEVKILPIPEPHKLRQELLSIEKITTVTFHLIHPNPGKREFDLYQSLIHDYGLKELDISMSNKEGFPVVEDKDKDGEADFKPAIESGISLVESGYGDVEFAGFDEVVVQGKKKKRITRKKKRFSSRRSVRNMKTEETDKPKLLSKIASFIMSVKDKKDVGEKY